MSPPVHTTTVTSVGTIIPSPGLSWLLNAIEGTVTEIDFDSVPDGTVIDTHYASSGVKFDAIDNNGAHMGSVFAGRPDPLVANNVITVGLPTSAFNDFEDGGIRVVFTKPQLFVSIDARPVIYTGEFNVAPDALSTPYLLVFGLPPQFPHHGSAPQLAKINFPIPNSNQAAFETWQTMAFLSTSLTPNIGSIEFSCHFTNNAAPVNAVFDNLRFAHHLPLGLVDDVG